MNIAGVEPILVQPLSHARHFNPQGCPSADIACSLTVDAGTESETEVGIEDGEVQSVSIVGAVWRIMPVRSVVPRPVVTVAFGVMMIMVMMAPVMPAMTFVGMAVMLLVSMMIAMTTMVTSPSSPAAGPGAGG